MPNYPMESPSVETPDGINLRTKISRPKQVTEDNNMAIVLVHPYSIMGGCQALMQGIASGLAEKGYPAVTFDMRGVGRSTGKPSLTGFAEVADVFAVCNWVSQKISSHNILLLGSSAGVPIAGSAVDQLEHVVGYVSQGYPFGMMASILFGRHHNAILQSA
ncbi:transcriptional regulator ATRX-like [Hibiscus syriacus]|uniref:Transcriptional regulator ATRX-like n=1 Tax=Hibiscus syriacus TaxID=106335 RepID=A0A6A3BEE3_HIBSY|nr:transcriptional regulator ATRX-like [Hibiscus syriacus]